MTAFDRRTVLRAAGAAVVAAGGGWLVAACSGNRGSREPRAKTGSALGPTADIPEGGGHVFTDAEVVVTQPAQGDFKGFSAICTHQGCLVNDVSDGLIHCPCHGSEFSIEDGSVQGGPAPSPLPAVQISVADGEVSVA